MRRFKDFKSGHIFVFLGPAASGKTILSRMLDLEKDFYIKDDFVCEKQECIDLVSNIYNERPRKIVIITHGYGFAENSRDVAYQPEQLIDRLKSLKEIGYDITVCRFERM